MNRGFWDTIQKPIIGLAPMDGVTDAAYRFIMDTYGHPSVLFTEFTSVEGIVRGAEKLLEAFIFHSTKTPTVAQVFGAEPQAFYQVAFLLCEMGFDGIDINMGCPDKNVAKRGGGAGLILAPKIAQEIVRKTRQAIEEWAEGKKIEDVGLPQNIIDFAKESNKKFNRIVERKIIPVSLKTRIGFDHIVTEWWMKTLLEVEPANISLHGRTLRQLYSGLANWEEIGKAADIVRPTKTSLLGNGDIKLLTDAQEKIKKYNLDGVLIGRASYGNPWVFTGEEVDQKKRFQVALEHVKAFEKYRVHSPFIAIRKNLAWYCRGFEGASEIRAKLVQVKSFSEAEVILNLLIKNDGR